MTSLVLRTALLVLFSSTLWYATGACQAVIRPSRNSCKYELLAPDTKALLHSIDTVFHGECRAALNRNDSHAKFLYANECFATFKGGFSFPRFEHVNGYKPQSNVVAHFDKRISADALIRVLKYDSPRDAELAQRYCDSVVAKCHATSAYKESCAGIENYIFHKSGAHLVAVVSVENSPLLRKAVRDLTGETIVKVLAQQARKK